tara:strand:- start:10137 stop:10712 length:576 start_codon:yes stop_codon:yes gene_type:complete
MFDWLRIFEIKNLFNWKIMSLVEIKRGTINDLVDLIDIGRKTFCETFAKDNSEENMNKYLEEGFSADKVRAEINDPNSMFYLAMVSDQVIGYLKLNFGQSQTELNDESSLEIERIYVLKELHGEGVGQKLYEKAVDIAREKEVNYIWLGVWEKNPRAIRFYEKNGFVEFDKHVFRLGDDGQTDIMMKLKLK